jgi:hypothetical protein
MIRHVLFVKVKASATEQAIEFAKQAFYDIPNRIEGITGVEWGDNMSPEDKGQSYGVCVLMTFRDEASRDTYLDHPEHDQLKLIFVPIIEDIIVIDYVV